MIALSDFMIRNRLGKSSATFTSNTLTYSPMKNKNAVALGRRGGKAKSQTYPRRAEGDNGEGKPRWPSKIHTLKKPCPFLGCKITNGDEHTDAT